MYYMLYCISVDIEAFKWTISGRMKEAMAPNASKTYCLAHGVFQRNIANDRFIERARGVGASRL